MKLKKGDRVRVRKSGEECFVERVTAKGKRVYCRCTTKEGEVKKVCFVEDDLEVIEERESPGIFRGSAF